MIHRERTFGIGGLSIKYCINHQLWVFPLIWILISGSAADVCAAENNGYTDHQTVEDNFTLEADLQQTWDSNYRRTPESDSENYQSGALGARAVKVFSRQKLLVGWKVRHFVYGDREDLNATAHNGQLSWQGSWNYQLRTKLAFQRNDTPVELSEFPQQDMIRRDLWTALIRYGEGPGMLAAIGALRTDQTHSNSLRDGLNYEENEANLAIGYALASEKELLARIRIGDREYPKSMPVTSSQSLGYDFWQGELEGTWVWSERSRLLANIAYFNREGDVNDGSGSLVSIEALWGLTDKTRLNLRYSLVQPVVGETSDSPDKEHIVSAGGNWQWTEKVTLSTNLQATEQQYERLRDGPARNEKVYLLTPLFIEFKPVETMSLQLKADWKERHSPLSYREYQAAILSIGVFLVY